MPAPTAPTLFQSYTPLESYQDLAEYLKRIKGETSKIQEERYTEVGTPAEIGARQSGRRMLENAAYLSSLPTGDTFSSVNPAVTEAASKNLSEAQKEYAKALEKVGERPAKTEEETPSWAKRTVF
jgi:hypothetical protein